MSFVKHKIQKKRIKFFFKTVLLPWLCDKLALLLVQTLYCGALEDRNQVFSFSVFPSRDTRAWFRVGPQLKGGQDKIWIKGGCEWWCCPCPVELAHDRHLVATRGLPQNFEIKEADFFEVCLQGHLSTKQHWLRFMTPRRESSQPVS